MKSIQLRTGLITGLTFFVMASLPASDASLSRSVDGIDIYMGITHSTQAEQNQNVHKMGFMKGIRGKKHHITVALFDNKTGQRITDAKVVAGIGEMGLSSNRKKLRQERFAEALTYGRDFYLSQQGPYWIDLKIKRNGMKQATVTRFEWNHY